VFDVNGSDEDNNVLACIAGNFVVNCKPDSVRQEADQIAEDTVGCTPVLANEQVSLVHRHVPAIT